MQLHLPSLNNTCIAFRNRTDGRTTLLWPKMRIRRWKQTQVMAPHSEKAGTISTIEAGRSVPGKGVAVRFINASHPRDAVSSKAVKSIRSHAAKAVQISRRAALTKNQIPPDNEMNTPLHSASSTTQSTADSLEMRARVVPVVVALGPANWLSSARKDPFQSFARPVTESEHFLFDHCRTPHSSMALTRVSVILIETDLLPRVRCHLCHSKFELLL